VLGKDYSSSQKEEIKRRTVRIRGEDPCGHQKKFFLKTTSERVKGKTPIQGNWRERGNTLSWGASSRNLIKNRVGKQERKNKKKKGKPGRRQKKKKGRCSFLKRNLGAIGQKRKERAFVKRTAIASQGRKRQPAFGSYRRLSWIQGKSRGNFHAPPDRQKRRGGNRPAT